MQPSARGSGRLEMTGLTARLVVCEDGDEQENSASVAGCDSHVQPPLGSLQGWC
jgi:hypothetical protein